MRGAVLYPFQCLNKVKDFEEEVNLNFFWGNEPGVPECVMNNGQKRTVLVIDDEESFAEVLALSLAFEGFVVLKAYNGIDGLNVFTQNQEYITAVLCDLNLPKMNGSQVIQAILSLQPDMRIVVMTGSIDEAIRAEFINHPSCIFLQKPFSTDAMIKSVKKEKV